MLTSNISEILSQLPGICKAECLAYSSEENVQKIRFCFSDDMKSIIRSFISKKILKDIYLCHPDDIKIRYRVIRDKTLKIFKAYYLSEDYVFNYTTHMIVKKSPDPKCLLPEGIPPEEIDFLRVEHFYEEANHLYTISLNDMPDYYFYFASKHHVSLLRDVFLETDDIPFQECSESNISSILSCLENRDSKIYFIDEIFPPTFYCFPSTADVLKYFISQKTIDLSDLMLKIINNSYHTRESIKLMLEEEDIRIKSQNDFHFFSIDDPTFYFSNSQVINEIFHLLIKLLQSLAMKIYEHPEKFSEVVNDYLNKISN